MHVQDLPWAVSFTLGSRAKDVSKLNWSHGSVSRNRPIPGWLGTKMQHVQNLQLNKLVQQAISVGWFLSSGVLASLSCQAQSANPITKTCEAEMTELWWTREFRTLGGVS